MKKNMFGKVVLLFLSLSVFFLFSACQMFTTSWGTKLQRNQQDVLKKASASDLLAFTQGSNASNPDTIKAVLNLLSTKSSEELRGLSLSEKEIALTLALDATLPVKKISQIAEDADNLTDDPDKVMRNLLKETDTFDTKASRELLKDPEAMRKADPNVLANAAVAVMLQVTAKNGGYDKIKSNIGSQEVDFNGTEDAGAIVTKMLGTGGSSEDRAALEAAVNTAMLLQGSSRAKDSDGKPVSRPGLKDVKLLGLMPLSDILDAF